MIIYAVALLLTPVFGMDVDEFFRPKQCDDFHYCFFGYCCKEGADWMCCQYPWQGDASKGSNFNRWTTTLRTTTTQTTTTTTLCQPVASKAAWIVIGSVAFFLLVSGIMLCICRPKTPRTSHAYKTVNGTMIKPLPEICAVDLPSYNSLMGSVSVTTRTDGAISSAPTTSNWLEQQSVPYALDAPPAYETLS